MSLHWSTCDDKIKTRIHPCASHRIPLLKVRNSSSHCHVPMQRSALSSMICALDQIIARASLHNHRCLSRIPLTLNTTTLLWHGYYDGHFHECKRRVAAAPVMMKARGVVVKEEGDGAPLVVVVWMAAGFESSEMTKLWQNCNWYCWHLKLRGSRK